MPGPSLSRHRSPVSSDRRHRKRDGAALFAAPCLRLLLDEHDLAGADLADDNLADADLIDDGALTGANLVDDRSVSCVTTDS